MFFLSLLLFSMIAAFLSGLLGIGGGLVFVPAFIFVAQNFGVDTGDIGFLKFAIINSFVLVLFSAIYGYVEHNRRKNIDMEIFNKLKYFYFFSAVFGGILFNIFENVQIKFIYIIFLGFVLILKLFKINFNKIKTNFNFYMLCVFNGIISPIVGVGGGIVNVAIFDTKINNIKRSVGTGAAISLMISLGGIIGFFLFGYENNLIKYIDLRFTLVGILSIIFIYKYGVKCTMLLSPYLIKIVLIVTLILTMVKSYFI